MTGGGTVLFSDAPGGGSPSAAPASARPGTADTAGAASVPHARHTPRPRPGGAPARARRAGRWAKVAQRIVPDDLQPEVLRVELTELGDAFRAYQRRPEPDLAVLAGLHDRKARAFALWADVTGDASLREEADRAAAAARTTREMDANRRGVPVDGEGPVVERLLTRGQGVHARNVLAHVRTGAPFPDAEPRLAVLMLTLRAARTGTGNVTGQDLGGWLQGDAERVLRELVDVGWLLLPQDVTADDALMSRPEEPAQITVSTLIPTQPRPFFFGKVTRARLSGWAQKVVGDRKLRKKKAGLPPGSSRCTPRPTAVPTGAWEPPARTPVRRWTRSPSSAVCGPRRSPDTPGCWSPPAGSRRTRTPRTGGCGAGSPSAYYR